MSVCRSRGLHVCVKVDGRDVRECAQRAVGRVHLSTRLNGARAVARLLALSFSARTLSHLVSHESHGLTMSFASDRDGTRRGVGINAHESGSAMGHA